MRGKIKIVSKIKIGLCLLCFVFGIKAKAQEISITLKNDSEKEQKAKEQLERLISTYDLSEWMYTKEVILDEKDPIPNSHPVLTLNCDYLDNDNLQLSVFIHEQLHWYLNTKEDDLENAVAEFKKLFSEVPVGGRQGARSEYSTYVHLVNCDLEYYALTKFIGEDKARKTIESWTHYQWIYDKVLNDERVREVNKKHNFIF